MIYKNIDSIYLHALKKNRKLYIGDLNIKI